MKVALYLIQNIDYIYKKKSYFSLNSIFRCITTNIPWVIIKCISNVLQNQF